MTYYWRNSDISAPLPPRPLVTSAPSHLGPTTTSAPVWNKSLVRSAPSHLGPIFIVTSDPSYNYIILMKRKKEKKYTASKKEPALLLHDLMICVYTFHQRKKQTNNMACAHREDSDHPGHPPSLIRVFAVRMKKAWVLTYPLSAHRRL